METNQRDTPLRRFNTFWWGLALFVVFGIICFVIKNFIQADDVYSADAELGKARLLIREQVDADQAELLDYKKEGDSVQLPPTALFPVASELNIIDAQPSDSGVPHKKEYK